MQTDRRSDGTQLPDRGGRDESLQGHATDLNVYPVGTDSLKDTPDADYHPLPLRPRRYLPTQGLGGLRLDQVAECHREGIGGIGLWGL